MFLADNFWSDLLVLVLVLIRSKILLFLTARFQGILFHRFVKVGEKKVATFSTFSVSFRRKTIKALAFILFYFIFCIPFISSPIQRLF